MKISYWVLYMIKVWDALLCLYFSISDHNKFLKFMRRLFVKPRKAHYEICGIINVLPSPRGTIGTFLTIDKISHPIWVPMGGNEHWIWPVR